MSNFPDGCLSNHQPVSANLQPQTSYRQVLDEGGRLQDALVVIDKATKEERLRDGYGG